MRRIVWSPQAADDLTEAINFLMQRNPQAAATLGERVFDMIERLARGELHGPAQKLTTGEEVHSWPVPPYRVYYQRDDDALHIVRVYHGRQHPITK